MKRSWIPPLLLLLLACAIYHGILSHSFLTNWDDRLYVTRNPAAAGFSVTNLKTAFTTFYVGNYAPIQIISYMLDYELWGMNPSGFKLTNILLHALCCILFYRLLTRHFAYNKTSAFVAAAIFLAHPVQVETVAWISQRKTLLAGIFMLLSLQLYLDYQKADRKKYLIYSGSLAMFLLSLLSKTVTMVLAPLLIIHDILSSRSAGIRRLCTEKLPYLLTGAVMIPLTMLSQSPEYGGGMTPYHGGSPYATFLTMLTVLPKYFKNIFFPANLSAVYYPPVKTAIDTEVILSGMFLIVLAIATVVLLRMNKKSAFWLFFFFIALLPVSQIVPITTLMNDRYLYIPLMGLTALIATPLNHLYAPTAYRWRVPVLGCCVAVTIALAATSWQRTFVWKDSITLWLDATRKYPGDTETWTGLANAYHNNNNEASALGYYLKALTIEPDNDIALNNAAIIYLHHNKFKKAEEYAVRAARIKPDIPDAFITLALCYLAQNDTGLAELTAKRALQLAPGNPDALSVMGNVFLATRRPDQAQQQFDHARQLQGETAGNLVDFASLAASRGDTARAIDLLERALALGYTNRHLLTDGPLFAPLLAQPRYRELLKRYVPLKEK